MTTDSTPTTSEPRCEFCDKPLEPIKLDLNGTEFVVGHKGCECDGATRREVAEDERRRIQSRDLERIRLLKCGIPKRCLEATADDALVEKGVDAMREGRNVCIIGPVGTGKTTLAACIAKRILLKEHMPARFTGFWQILDRIKASFDGGSDPLPYYQQVTNLILDDFGKESPTDFTLDRMFSLIDARYNGMLPTLFTMQMQPDQLAKKLAKNGDAATAQAIVSRLMQGAVPIVLSGKDRRLS